MSHHDMSQHDHLTGVILNASLLSFTIICLTKFIIKLFIAVSIKNNFQLSLEVNVLCHGGTSWGASCGDI